MNKHDPKYTPHTTMQPQEALFETIYQSAKAKDEKALAKIIDSIGANVIFQGEDQQAMRLAEEGDYESVEFLLNKFKANINYAVRGAACGGHVEFTNHLIGNGASLDYAVWGAAYGGHKELTNALLDRGASLNFAVYGAASGNHVELTNELIDRDASLSYAVWGAAFGGHAKLTNALLKRGANINNAVHGAAFGGHVTLTNELIERGAKLNNAVNGAASGGHIALSNDLINRGASINHAVQGAAGGGYIAFINDLISIGADLKYAARGIASLEHSINTQNDVLRLISLIDNAELRTLLAKNAKKTIPSLDAKALCEQAKKLNGLMREKKLTFNQAQEMT